ncbi:related to AMP-binding domain protein [Phialocephala subalpina]|uniref:Related to AMP-binding domain protein n=1 Tax=Phialocephala subalpina TaxID=576137 RepID=A0A1L7XT79_9HELO|nr:related to AMP-binding domain protein [Phialocephala subalpina]
MTVPKERLPQFATRFPQNSPPNTTRKSKGQQFQRPNFHPLSPTYFLPRAAAIDPEATAICHVTRNDKILRRSYREMSDRARGLAYYLESKGYKRVGILAPNTPAFLEAVYGIGAAGAINVGMIIDETSPVTRWARCLRCLIAINYRLNSDDTSYIFTHAEVDGIIADAEFVGLLNSFLKENPHVDVISDTDGVGSQDQPNGPFDEAVLEGLRLDNLNGNKGWDGLEVQPESEHDIIAFAYTSGTTAKPKAVEFLHRGAYLASLANTVEYGFGYSRGSCRYLWTLPMFHAMGWCGVWAVTAVRGTHYCLRKIDYSTIWHLLKQERITHFSAAPTVNTLLCNAKEAEVLPEPVQVMVAGSPPTPHLFEQMTNLNFFPTHVYGPTETYGPITKSQGHGFLASLGARVIKSDLPDEVVDVEQNGEEIGEVVFAGIFAPMATIKTRKQRRNSSQAESFIRGILPCGTLTELFRSLTERRTSSSVGRGENISSVALESLLIAHPDILEVAAVAVSDSHWGERPKAFVTAKSGKHVNGADVITWAKNASGISKFMVPREVEVVDELPKTSTGKIRKDVLRQRAKSGRLQLKL